MLPFKATVFGPKALTLREGANKTTQKVGAVSSGDDVMVLELTRTRTGTLRARTQCGWTTAATREGRQLLDIDGDLEQLLMRQLFAKCDTDADGKLDSAQLKRFRDSLTPGQPPDFAAHGAMMAEIGAPGGLVTLAMYVDWLAKERGAGGAGGTEPEPEPESEEEQAARMIADAMRTIEEAQAITKAAVESAHERSKEAAAATASLNAKYKDFQEMGDKIFEGIAKVIAPAMMGGVAASGAAAGGPRRLAPDEKRADARKKLGFKTKKAWKPPQDDATRLKALGAGKDGAPPWMERCLLEW